MENVVIECTPYQRPSSPPLCPLNARNVRSSNKKVICILEYFSAFLQTWFYFSLFLFLVFCFHCHWRQKERPKIDREKESERERAGEEMWSCVWLLARSFFLYAQNGNTAFSRSLRTHRSMKKWGVITPCYKPTILLWSWRDHCKQIYIKNPSLVSQF